MEIVVGNTDFLTIVAKSKSGETKYPLKAPTFRQMKEFSKKQSVDSFDSLEKLLIDLGLPEEVLTQLSVVDVNAISEKIAELITKKK
jgi:hypothetical protein